MINPLFSEERRICVWANFWFCIDLKRSIKLNWCFLQKHICLNYKTY